MTRFFKALCTHYLPAPHLEMLEIKTRNKTKQELLLTTGELKVFEMWADGWPGTSKSLSLCTRSSKNTGMGWWNFVNNRDYSWFVIADWALLIEINQARFSDKQETRINKKLGLECSSLTDFFSIQLHILCTLKLPCFRCARNAKSELCCILSYLSSHNQPTETLHCHHGA